MCQIKIFVLSDNIHDKSTCYTIFRIITPQCRTRISVPINIFATSIGIFLSYANPLFITWTKLL
nr:MAG TPA: hypothetical protein [Caudoviricetes sp.]